MALGLEPLTPASLIVNEVHGPSPVCPPVAVAVTVKVVGVGRFSTIL
jgi:hypothetical protein